MLTKTVLLIAEELPLPHHSGYSTYNHAFLSALLANGYQVHLLISGNRFPSAYFNPTQLLGLAGLNIHIPQAIGLIGGWFIAKPLGLLKVLYRKMRGHAPGLGKRLNRQTGNTVMIGRWLNERDIARLTPVLQAVPAQQVFVDTLFRSPILASINSNSQKFLIGHDVFSQRCLSLAGNGFKPVPWVSAEDEALALQKFDVVIAITEADGAEYRRLNPNGRVIVLPSPVTPAGNGTVRSDSGRIFYLGSQAHHNVDGLEWFLAEIWPLVLQENPALWLDVVGAIGSSISGKHPNLTLHGRLDSFSSLAGQAMFSINPVRAGSGMKIKILDYLAHGLACITTSVGIAGFPDQSERPIAVCDDAESFARTLLDWGSDAAYCSMLSRQALDYVRQFSSGEFNAGLQQIMRDSQPRTEHTA